MPSVSDAQHLQEAVVSASCRVQSPVKLQSINIPSVHQHSPAVCSLESGTLQYQPMMGTVSTADRCALFQSKLEKVDVQNREAFPCKSSMSQGNQAHCHTNSVYSHSVLLSKTAERTRWPSWVGMHYVQSVHLFFCQTGNFLRAGLYFFSFQSVVNFSFCVVN